MAEIQVLIALPEEIRTGDAYEALCDFARYPDLADSVLSVACGAHSETGEAVSTWNVKFREGILQWTEIDHFHERDKTIGFELLEGDLDQFSGQWSVVEGLGQPPAIRFQAEFNLGIPSLSHILDPLAVESLGGSVRQIVAGLVSMLEGCPPLPPGARTLRRSTQPIGDGPC
jgi:hypothetical protein